MARHRISDRDEASDLARDTPLPKRHKNNHKVHVGQKANHSMSGVGMDGFELDPQAVREALTGLNGLRNELQRHLTRAEELAEHLPDGGGPVALVMRKTFHSRANDQDGGVQAALRDYLAEVDATIHALQATLASYADLESDAVTGLGTAGNGVS